MNKVQLIQVSALLGAVFPLLAAFFKQSGLSKQANTAICVVLAGIESLVLLVSQGQLTAENWSTSFVLLYTTAGASFKNLWQPLGIEGWLKSATSVIKPPGVVEAHPSMVVDPLDVVDTAMVDPLAHPPSAPMPYETPERDLSRGTGGAQG